MNNRAVQYRGLSCAAWGYFFLNFDIHIGTVGILPGFVGFLLLLSAIASLSGERRDLLLLRPLCIFFAAFGIVDWFLSIFGQGLDGHFLFLDLLVMAARLYFHFQFLTDIAAIAETCQQNGEKLAVQIQHRRTAYILLHTAIAVYAILSGSQASSVWLDGMVLLLLACSIASLSIMAALFRLRKCLLKEMAGV